MATPNVDKLFNTMRETLSERAWSQGVNVARSGGVVGLTADEDELRLSVVSTMRPSPYEVHLWPGDEEWSCECGHAACVHAAAAVIAAKQAIFEGKTMPKPQNAAQLVYLLTEAPDGLVVKVILEYPDGRAEPLTGRVRADRRARPNEGDLEADDVLRLGDRNLPATGWERLIRAWAGSRSILRFEGRTLRASTTPVTPVVVVSDHEGGFRVNLRRPKEVQKTFRGNVALVGDELRPWSEGGLAPHQRQVLARGVDFTTKEVGRLVGDLLPSLRNVIPVKVQTERLPQGASHRPSLSLDLRPTPSGGAIARLDLVYGDPPVARLVANELQLIGKTIPLRDVLEERRLLSEAEQSLRLPVGREIELDALELMRLSRDRLPLFTGKVNEGAERMRARKEAAQIRLSERGDRVESDADPKALIRAWREGAPLVPLKKGGFAPLPTAFLEQHGHLLAELVAASDKDGALPPHTLPAAAELARALDQPPPADLGALRPLVEGFEGLPEVAPPAGLQASLRPYQLLGFRWIRFLWSVNLAGVLADDMGLGKTLQALCALVDRGGQSLIVAPTSVLFNWAAEARRFFPHLKVNLFHGPRRRHDPSADLTITSYALLRLDPSLRERVWSVAVLDEAQAIKNPESQTAQAAFALRAERRLSLTGTPVENRLDELWSQLHFLMPGFLGGRADFRDRIERPVSEGVKGAAEALRRRVRPFVLRRRKQEVAKDLPPKTELTLRCELPEAQRAVYDAVAQAARAEVVKLVGGGRTLEVLELLLRLRQAACHPALLPGQRPGVPSGKLDVLLDQLDEVVSEGHKALVFSQWTSFLDLIEAALRERQLKTCRLDGATRDRAAVVRTFQADDGPPIFLLSLKAGGTGLNLTAADYVFHADPWWNPAAEAQATDRAHRIGQDKPVFSMRLIAADTVEERILELQDKKRALAEAALGEGELVEGLSRDELLALFD
ncbi:MAG: DEAD/DEAH box helicase [Deltaproteobacteria bacterium]|nr:DEAD/DEAH box helicase [Deltaproteobacteria bacterium]